MKAMRIQWLIPVVLMLGACAPAVDDGRASVALINAPADHRVSTVADELELAMREVPGCCEFDFASSAAVRFQETHRDMFGSRAAPQAASLARNLGAELAVMVGAPVFEREVSEAGGTREVRGTVQLEAIVLDPATAGSLATVGSLEFTDRWVVEAGEELPEPEQDPRLLDLASRAVDDLAPHLAAVVGDLMADKDYRK